MYLGEFPLFYRTLGWSYHNIFLCSIGFSDPLIGYFFCRSIFQFVSLLQSLDPQYSLISLLLFVIGYVHLISLILWEMHTLWGSSHYICLLTFSSHFGNRCQWGRNLEGLREYGFVLLHPCSLCCMVAYSLYKPSKKGLSSITKMGEIEKACVAPSVVLVINDNPCGLMFALRYSCRSCP